MGCDIYGTVEYKEGNEWKFALTLEDNYAINRDYDMFGLLFGVYNYASFEPVASSRGVPDNITVETWAELDPEGLESEPDCFGNRYSRYNSLSWITLKEINSIDPKTRSLKRDERVHHYAKTKNGMEIRAKSLITSGLTRGNYDQLEKFNRVEIGDYVYAYEFVQAEGMVHFNHKLQAKLDELGRTYGEENVRLVVGLIN